MNEDNEQKKTGRAIGIELVPGKKYEEILKQQEVLNEHIKEIGDEGYQRLFVEEKAKGFGYWLMVGLIVISLIALITSLPIDWGQILGD